MGSPPQARAWLILAAIPLMLAAPEFAHANGSASATDPHPAAAAPASSSAVLTFEIKHFDVAGNTLLSTSELHDLLAAYTGKGRDFGAVQRALEALQKAYKDRGYGAVAVTLPEQTLENGVVRFNVIETRIAQVNVEDNHFFNASNVRASLPTLRAGTVPNSRDIATNLRVVNDNPAKHVSVVLQPGDRDGTANAAVKVHDSDPQRYSVTLDNTGTSDTGRFRLGLAYQNANLFDRDQVLTAQFITSPDNPNKVNVFGLGYHVPLYAQNASIDAVAGYSSVNSGVVQDLFVVSGKGSIFALRYNQYLPRFADIDQQLSFGVDYRSYRNNVTTVGSSTQLVPDIAIHPFSLTYSGHWLGQASQIDFYAGISQNLFPGGNDDSGSDFDAVRVGAKAGYRIYRAGLDYSRLLPHDWQARASFTAQYTNDALVPGEQFALGGAASVRGFQERYFADDKGYRSSFELYTPNVASKLGWNAMSLRFLTFYDTGWVGRNLVQAGENPGGGLDSIGVGLRVAVHEKLFVRMDFAQVLHDGSQINGPDGRNNSQMLHVSMAWLF
ncbi:MAG TPA: ShlB/FhaC/HecB family hemolysin secretion/activation protein [Burkholderiales bacterium]|nr:ShlB/FhaC/HecB family hemolysin secretion/activation protein [Burkholderiales bacterium]